MTVVKADKALTDECNSVLLDYTESRLEGHLQTVNAISISIQDYGGDECDIPFFNRTPPMEGNL